MGDPEGVGRGTDQSLLGEEQGDVEGLAMGEGGLLENLTFLGERGGVRDLLRLKVFLLGLTEPKHFLVRSITPCCDLKFMNIFDNSMSFSTSESLNKDGALTTGEANNERLYCSGK